MPERKRPRRGASRSRQPAGGLPPRRDAGTSTACWWCSRRNGCQIGRVKLIYGYRRDLRLGGAGGILLQADTR